MAGFQLTLYGRIWVTPEGRLRTVFRALSVLACIEGTVGFLLAAHSLSVVRVDKEALEYLMGYLYSQSGWLLYPMDCAHLLP
jgi:hypothetical protein